MTIFDCEHFGGATENDWGYFFSVLSASNSGGESSLISNIDR
jgi:hypothetical protein